MKWILARLAILLLLASCTSGVKFGSPHPYVVFHTGDNIEITENFAAGVQKGFNEAEAMELLTRECGGTFRVMNRTKTADMYLSMPFALIKNERAGRRREAWP